MEKVTLQTTISKESADQIKALADKDGRKVSAYIRVLIQRELNTNKDKFGLKASGIGL